MITLYAHRGASAELPENTMGAFARAVELGVHALELDVHTTADGAVVVFHDTDGRRMAGVDRRVAETPQAEVATWDVGWGFVGPGGARPHHGKGHRVPLLADLLAAWPGVPLNIDLKPRGPRIVEATLRVIRDQGAEDRCLLASFHGPTLRAVRAAGYRGPTGSSRDEVARVVLLPTWLARGTAGDRVQIPVRYGPVSLATPGLVARCRALGKRLDYWTVDDPVQARALLRLGADGLMTNDPAALLPLLG